MEIGFDLISDLNLSPEESFNWENKATSLYCLIAGNVSSDLRTVYQTLSHLCRFYQGIFYVPGLLEYENCDNADQRTAELIELTSRLPKVSILFHNVVLIDGVAILGVNGWSADIVENINPVLIKNRLDDIGYLNRSIAKLQKHLDVKKILVLSACIPKKELYFGQVPDHVGDHLYPDFCFKSDTELKITNWAFGSVEKEIDTIYNGVHYVNNPYYKKRPYWAKRIGISI